MGKVSKKRKTMDNSMDTQSDSKAETPQKTINNYQFHLVPGSEFILVLPDKFMNCQYSDGTEEYARNIKIDSSMIFRVLQALGIKV